MRISGAWSICGRALLSEQAPNIEVDREKDVCRVMLADVDPILPPQVLQHDAIGSVFLNLPFLSNAQQFRVWFRLDDFRAF